MKKRSPIVWIILIVESLLLLWSLFGYVLYLSASNSGQLPPGYQNYNTGELLLPIVIGLMFLGGAIALFQFRKVSVICFIAALGLSILAVIIMSFQFQVPIAFKPVWIVQIFVIAYAISLKRRKILY